MKDETYVLLQELHQLLKEGIVTQEEFAFKKQELLAKENNEQPVAADKLPDITEAQPVGANNFDFGEWMGRNKWWLIAAIVCCGGLYTGWYFFIRHDPEKDAKTAAAQYCDCREKNYEQMAKNDEQFIKSFNGSYYSSKQQARAKWSEIQNDANAQWQDCFSKFEIVKNRLRLRHRGKNGDIFDATYNAETENYKAKYQDKYNKLETDIYNLINTIKNPTPDADRIKSDLIGQRTQFWTFNYLSEISSVIIHNTIENGSRLELTAQLKLQSESTGEHDADVILVYYQDGENWTFNSVKMNSITYEYLAPVDYWKSITKLENVRTNIDYQNHKIWVRFPCNGEEIMQGPDVEFDGRGCSYGVNREIKSRESTPVTIKYTYTPIN